MFTKQKIQIVAAHPDDFEIGCGQLIFSLLKNGCQVEVLVVTDGSSGGDTSVRIREQRDCIEYLRDLRDYPIHLNPSSFGKRDTTLEAKSDLISHLEGDIRKFKPDAIFTHWPEDTHQDHRELGISIISAARKVDNIIFFQSYTSRNFQPCMFHAFPEKHLEIQKWKLLSFHKSQVNRYKGTNSDLKRDIFTLARHNGHVGRTSPDCAEAFIPYKLSFD